MTFPLPYTSTDLSEQVALVTSAAGALGARFAKTLASAGLDGIAVLWDVASRAPLRQLTASKGSQVFSVAFSPDGQTVALGRRSARETWPR